MSNNEINLLSAQVLTLSKLHALESVVFAFLKENCKSSEELAKWEKLFHSCIYENLNNDIANIEDEVVRDEISKSLNPILHDYFSRSQH
jgi:hypothetical protein